MVGKIRATAIILAVVTCVSCTHASRMRRGGEQLALRNYDSAISIFKQEAEDEPGEAEPRYRLGMCYEEQGRLDAAQSEYRKALDIDRTRYDVRERLALCYLKAGMDLYAAELFLIVIAEQPGNELALFKLGVILQKQGKPDDAVSYYRRCLKLNPAHPRANHNLGAILSERPGDEPEALDCFKRYLESKPGEENGETKKVEEWVREHSTGVPR
jgi:tetratricopeptide (TPR) repeat protein